MVKFLLQHALALDDKESEDELDGPWSWPLPNSDGYIHSAYADTGLRERSQVAERIIKDMRMRRQ
jgi:hypothetical protein